MTLGWSPFHTRESTSIEFFWKKLPEEKGKNRPQKEIEKTLGSILGEIFFVTKNKRHSPCSSYFLCEFFFLFPSDLECLRDKCKRKSLRKKVEENNHLYRCPKLCYFTRNFFKILTINFPHNREKKFEIS